MISRRALLGAGTAAAGLAALPSAAAASGLRRARSTTGSSFWAPLAGRLHGQLVLPGDPSYPIAKQLELGQFDGIDPRAVAYCLDAHDVSLAVRFAQDQGLPVAARSGGHSYGGYSSTPGLIIDQSRNDAVTVNSDQSVLIGPGAENVDILNSLAPHGLVVSEGGCPTVAAGGFIQGGGFGFLTRPTGMACDALTSAQVVLADGTTVTASAQEHPELFWAIRGGGGGNFGIVTSYDVAPHVGDQMQMVNLVFPYANAADVLDGAAQWLVDAPSTIGGGGYVVQTDAAAGVEPALNVMLASRGTPTELAAETARLLALTGAPTLRQDAAMTYQQLMMLVFGCSTLTPDQCQRAGKTPQGQLSRPVFGLERSRLGSTPYTSSAWADVMTAFDANPQTGQARYLDFQMFGGAANTPARTDTAYVHRDSLFSVNYRVLVNDPAQATPANLAVATQWANHGFDTIDPLSNGESYQNWIDPALTDWRRSYYAENYPKLLRIKHAYDPHRFFAFAQGIGA